MRLIKGGGAGVRERAVKLTIKTSLKRNNIK